MKQKYFTLQIQKWLHSNSKRIDQVFIYFFIQKADNLSVGSPMTTSGDFGVSGDFAKSGEFYKSGEYSESGDFSPRGTNPSSNNPKAALKQLKEK